MNRTYGLMGVVTKAEARKIIAEGEVTDTWKDYSGGPRPGPAFIADEPMDGFWLKEGNKPR